NEAKSMAPHAAQLRNGQKMGALQMVDTMISDGLMDAFHGIHMGITAENVAREYQITREEQDRFAVDSQNKAEAARKAGRFKDEIVPVTVTERKGVRVVDSDEYIREGVTYESVSGLRAAFNKDGTVTAATASGLNGGALAIGQPVGASGGRILVTLLYEMQRRDAKKGIATMCIGGGMGIAVCVER